MKKTFGQELRRLRAEAGLSMADLADTMKCSIVYISDIERSRRNPPSPPDIERLLVRLGKQSHSTEMQRLAAEARNSIEIPVHSSSGAEVNDMLVALARRAKEGQIDEEIARRIREILESRNEA